MLEQILFTVGELFLRITIAVLMVLVVYRVFFFLFNIDIRDEIKADNRSAAIFFLAIIVMIGLIVGLFQL